MGLLAPPWVQVCNPHSSYDKGFTRQERKRASTSVIVPAHNLIQGYQGRQDQKDILSLHHVCLVVGAGQLRPTCIFLWSPGPTANTNHPHWGPVESLWQNLSPDLSWKNKRWGKRDIQEPYKDRYHGLCSKPFSLRRSLNREALDILFREASRTVALKVCRTLDCWGCR